MSRLPETTVIHDLVSPTPSIEGTEGSDTLDWNPFRSQSSPSAAASVFLLEICVEYKYLYRRLSGNVQFWMAVSDASGWAPEEAEPFLQATMAKYRVADHTIRPVDPDGYRIEALSWQMANHIAQIRTIAQIGRSRYQAPTPVPEDSMSGQEIEEAILERVRLAAMRCDFDQAKWLLLHIHDKQKADTYMKELESNIILHDQREKCFEMESAKAESDGEWGKARSWLLLLANKVRSGRLLVALERRKAIQDKYNRGLQEETVLAQFVDRDLAKACSLVSKMKGKRPKAFVALFKCNEALTKNDFNGAMSTLSNPQLASAHISLKPMVDLAEALYNDDQDEATSLSLLLKMDAERFQKLFLNSSAGDSAERCDGQVGALSLLLTQPVNMSTHLNNYYEKQSKADALRGDWNEAQKSLLKIPKKTVSGPLLRKLEAELSAFYEKDMELEKQAKEAEMNGDWEKARSFLSRIESDFGKFLLAALAYSEARLSHKDEHLEMLVQLQEDYPDPRLEQSDPDDFRKVFEMMAEDMRDAYDRACQAQGIHIAEESPSSENMQARLQYCPDTGPPSSSLPAIPRDPCLVIPSKQAIREYQWDRPELPSLSFDQQLVLLQICLVHKGRYTNSQGNINFWHRVADQFWEVSGWHWKRIRMFVQKKLRCRAASDRGPQMGPLLDELQSHIHAVGHPRHRSSVTHSSPQPSALQSPVGSLPGQGSANQSFSPTKLNGRINSDSMFHGRLAGLSSRPSELQSSVEGLPVRSAAKRTLSQTEFDVPISSDDDLPSHPPSQPRHTGPASSSVHTHAQNLLTGTTVQSLIAKGNEAKEQHDFDKAKSLLLQIPDKTIFGPLLEELDEARESQIQTNKDFERQAKKAELEGDWETAKSLLSRVVGEDGSFLLLALEYIRTRRTWKQFEAQEYLEQLKKEYPHPIFKQVELDHDYENAKITGNPRRIGYHQGLLRAYKRKSGSVWDEPDDFRKAFQLIASDMRHARDKVWYAHPARAGRTELQSQPQPEFYSGFNSHAGLESEAEVRSQSQPRYQPQQIDIPEVLRILERARTQAQAQPRSQRPNIDQELALLDRAREEIFNGRDRIKAILLQGSSEESKEALKAVENNTSRLLADFEESATSLMVQAGDESDEWDEWDEWTPESQRILLLLMEAESRANEEKFNSLMRQIPRNSTEARNFRKEFAESKAKKDRYLQRCKATLDAGGRLEEVEEE
ncbi:hypothetical protein PEX2_061770 [Penicillium expansum]|uniref:Uncharacterized protein n=1 Tax=Penicillium expansum TaxID=27334 RepID=A0A0A2JDY3_PENEN|nr:hypothetical protein PEX2_061770 [Penicillium expansum]KGO53569.1 hypothetical protein PEX2_061770 [Penicillium expansum]